MKLNDLCRDIVFERDGYECLICKALGKTAKSKLQPGHIISRQYILLAYEVDDIVTLCKNHHVYAAHINKALTEDILTAWFIAAYPERWEKIIQLKRVFTGDIYQLMFDCKNELERIKGEMGL